MPSLDDEIDALYALAPAAFTAARNALAKRAGDRAVEVKALAKPSAPAWAVNQLYWHRRAVFDALVKASETRRAAHVDQMAGRPADVARADARHRASLDAALTTAVAFLRDAGDAASPATVTALERTLEVVPSPDVRGRLTRPLEPVGFSALAALMNNPGASLPRQPADVVVMKRPRKGESARSGDDERDSGTDTRATKAAEAAVRRAEAERQRERERDRLTNVVADARKKEREATAVFSKAREAAERASDRVAKLEQELDVARRQAWELREEAERARRDTSDATAARVALERELQAIPS